VENPRIEAEEHYYNPTHTGLKDLGLKPHYLDEKTLVQMLQFVKKHKEAIDQDQIFRQVKWA
jgi:UDP-sulfoquinovose synthase